MTACDVHPLEMGKLAEDDPEGETVEVLNQEMMLRFGDYAYEIVAVWNSEEYYGEVSYVFRVIC